MILWGIIIKCEWFYLLLLFFGLAAFLDNLYFQVSLGVIGTLVLLYLGFKDVKTFVKKKHIDLSLSKASKNSFMTGFLINFSNPLAIIYWLGFYGLVSTTPAYNSGTVNMLLNILTVLIGATVWGLILSGASHFGRKLVNDKVLGYVSLVAGLILIGFGLFLGYRTFVML